MFSVILFLQYLDRLYQYLDRLFTIIRKNHWNISVHTEECDCGYLKAYRALTLSSVVFPFLSYSIIGNLTYMGGVYSYNYPHLSYTQVLKCIHLPLKWEQYDYGLYQTSIDRHHLFPLRWSYLMQHVVFTYWTWNKRHVFS